MNINPIKSQKEYKKALAQVNDLWEAKPNTKEGDLLEVLTILIDRYESQQYPILPPDPIEAIKFRMEQLSLSPGDLAACLGGRNRVSEILRKKRKLTIKMIRNLHQKLNIPYESLLSA